MHRDTTIQAYQLRTGGSRARMAILRMKAADSVRNANPHTRLNPGDWKGARHWKLNTYESAYGLLSQGREGGTPVWYSHNGPEFRNECDAHIYVSSLPLGWYTDDECCDKAIGIVASLTHGRFIAGYRWTSNDERVYFPEIFDDAADAARMADEHARVFAELARDDNERFHAMQDAENRVDELRTEVCGLWPGRNASQYIRNSLRESINSLRDALTELSGATAAYERG